MGRIILDTLKRILIGVVVLFTGIGGFGQVEAAGDDSKSEGVDLVEEVSELEGSGIVFDEKSLEKLLKSNKNEISRATKRVKVLEDKLTLMKSENQELVEEINRVEKLIETTLDRIRKIEDDILKGRAELDTIYEEIDLLEIELAEREADFRERVMVSSTVSFMNYVEVVVRSESFSDMLTKLAGVKTVINRDNVAIEEYLELSEELADRRDLAEEKVRELDEKHESLLIAKESLDSRNKSNKRKSSSGLAKYEKLTDQLATLKTDRNGLLDERKRLKYYVELAKEYKEYKKQEVGVYGLHPLLDAKRVELIKLAELQGIRLVTTSGLRTFAEQNALYAKGRTAPGNVVTNARAGDSWHNYGLAFDVVFDNGRGDPTWEEYDMNKNGLDDWDEIGKIGSSIGLEWGGYWTGFLDRPHFQYTFGKSLSEMKKIHKLD